MLLANIKISKTLATWIRKSTLLFALLATIGMGSSFANPTGSSKDIVMTSFHKDFRTAVVMKVETGKDFTKVTFNLNTVVMFAYYGEDGDLLAVVRNIVSSQLPIQLLMDLKNKCSGCWISDLFEINSNGQTSYYVTLENSDFRTILRADDSNRWETFKKQAKEL